MIEPQDKPEEKLEQKQNISQKLEYIFFTPFMKFGKFMSNEENKSNEEIRKGTYILSNLYKNAIESYFKTEEEYGSSPSPIKLAEIVAKGTCMGGIGALVMVEHGIRQIYK